MAVHISQAIVLLSGAVTGVAAIAALSYYRHRNDPSNTRRPTVNNQSTQNQSTTTESNLLDATSSSNRASRLRRSRSIRRRRNRNSPDIIDNDANLSDAEEDVDMKKVPSLFKEWNDDENRNLLNLLSFISLNQSRKEGFIHRGITCNKCNMSPIRGIRYKCANCVDFDLCEMCEGANNHINTHVFLKIRIPIPPLANPRSALLPAFYPGKYHSKTTLSSEKYRELQRTTHFDIVELEALYEQFKSLSTVDRDDGGIDRETFEQCLGPLGLEKNLITERIFAFFDQDGDNVISFPEIVAGLSVLCKGNLDEKIEYAFKGYDLDEDGYISRDELYRMYKSYFYLSMELVRDVVSAMEDEMMDSFEFSASQPVSAAFNVAVPSSPSDRNASDEEDDSDDKAGPSKKRRYPLKEDHFLKQYAIEAEKAQALSSDTPVEDVEPPQQRSDKKAWEEKFPIMETMSQGAINEMVDKTFKSIKTEREGYINFEEFKECVQTDSSIVSWFEALGTVF